MVTTQILLMQAAQSFHLFPSIQMEKTSKKEMPTRITERPKTTQILLSQAAQRPHLLPSVHMEKMERKEKTEKTRKIE